MTLLKKIGMALLVAILCVAMVLPAYAAEGDSPSRVVRVSCGINKALYLDEDGQPAGYCAAYLQQLAKINGWTLEYVENSWADSVQALQNGEIDLLFPTQMTAERQEIMAFSSSIGGYQPIGLFARADSELCYDDYEGFDGARIAFSPGSSNELCLKQYAEENGFSYTPVPMDSAAEKMTALENGDVDMIVFSTLNDVESGKVVAMLDYLPFYYCTNKDDTELMSQLNYGMNQMLLRNPVMVQEVFCDFMNRNISFAYTKAEEEEVQRKGGITVGIYEDTPPLFDENAQEGVHGVYVDLIERVKAISGLEITLKAVGRDEDPVELLRSGEIDFFLGPEEQLAATASGDEFVHSDGIMDYYTIAITKPNYTPSNDKAMVVALTYGREYWADKILENCPGATFQYYKTSRECLDALQKGNAELTLINTWEYNYQSKNSRFRDLIEWETSRTLTETTFTSLSSGNALIRSVLDKAIEQIANAEKEGIITANLNTAYEEYNFEDWLYSAKEVLVIFALVMAFLLAAFVLYTRLRRKNMQALQQSNEQLTEANAAKDRFLSRMSHELRTPLNAINGSAAVIEQAMDEPTCDKRDIKENLTSINRAVQYQMAIIGDLLDIQRIESGKMQTVKAEADAETYMSSILEMIRPEAERKNIHFTYERLTFTHETYLVDGVRLQQVLLNLLYNAVKFTPAGGAVTLTAGASEQDEQTSLLTFVVTDSGIGMSEAFQQKYLFRRFAQEYSDNTSPYEGCGMGLALSKELMTLMGGDITCRSEKGVGSTFTVTLPAEHIVKKKRRARRSYPKYDMAGVRVLLCEDNPMNQDIERRILEKMDCAVEIADDGVIGLEKFSRSAEGYYDAVLMDIRMPNMDGWECTERIRALERQDSKTVLIAAISANAFETDVQHSFEVGMNEHLPKPVDVKTLCETILRYVHPERLAGMGQEASAEAAMHNEQEEDK